MAIVVEEENPYKFSWISIATWLVIGAIFIVAVYYIFFKNPQLAETVIPSSFQNTQQISQLALQPEDIANNPVFRTLKSLAASTTVPIVTGRPNPFAPY